MKLFGFEIKRVSSEPPAIVRAITTDDWVKSRAPGWSPGWSTVRFEQPFGVRTKVSCDLSCKVRGVIVRASGEARNSGAAFQRALVAIEDIIGDGWRKDLNAAVVVTSDSAQCPETR